MDIEGILARLVVRHQRGDIYDTLCPAHPDSNPSMTVSKGERGGVVVHCNVGCTFEQIAAAIGLTPKDFMGEPYVVAEYKYTDVNGNWLYSVQRWHPKDFRCVPGLPAPAKRVLYNMPAVGWCHSTDTTLYIVEGERDVDTLNALGIPSTCNVGGAGKWLPQYTEAVRGLNVVIIADNDDPGRAHAREIARQLKGNARLVTTMYSPYGKDVSDLIEAGYTVDALQLLPDAEGGSIYTASGVKTRKVQWAWDQRIPLGKLTSIDGDPGGGKSLMTLDWAARWSTGTPMPGETEATIGPVPVILVSAEDDIDDTIVPRLIRAGANLDLIKLIPHGITPKLPFDMGTDLAWLEEEIMTVGARVVILDPLMAFLPDKTDSHSDHSTRRALGPLKYMASTTGAATLLVRHLNKGGSGTKAMYRGGGSIAFIGAARAGFMVGRSEEDSRIRLVVGVKANLARDDMPALSYTVEAEGGVPYVVWGDAVAITAQEVADGGPKKPAGPTATDDEIASRRKGRSAAHNWLVHQLGVGPLPWEEVLELAKDVGFSPMTLRRARDDCPHMHLVHGAGGARDATWHLTESDGEAPVCSFAHVPRGLAVPVGAEQMTKREPDGDSEFPDGQSEEDRDAALAEMPKHCTICKTEVGARAFGKPYWVYRCRAHDPRTYGAQL